MELMIETPQSILNEQGQCALPEFRRGGRRPVPGAALPALRLHGVAGITAAHQRLGHPACDFAREMIQVAFAGTEFGSPMGPQHSARGPSHRTAPGGLALFRRSWSENRATIHRAWKLHFEGVRHSLANGFYRDGNCTRHNSSRAMPRCTIFSFGAGSGVRAGCTTSWKRGAGDPVGEHI